MTVSSARERTGRTKPRTCWREPAWQCSSSRRIYLHHRLWQKASTPATIDLSGVWETRWSFQHRGTELTIWDELRVTQIGAAMAGVAQSVDDRGGPSRF